MTRTPVEVGRHFFVKMNHLWKALATTAIAIGLMFGAGIANAQLPKTSVQIDRKDTALVVIDPQNDVLSEKGVSWGLLGDSVKENNTVENIARLFRAAKEQGFEVFISPHYLYPTDQSWQFGGAVEKMMLEGKEFWRPDPLSLDGFSGSGADWLDRYKPFIKDGKTVVASPHKVYGLQSNDLVLQLRKRRINKVILAGMMANLCVETHLRELLEQGFEVVVVKDATAVPRHPELGDGYKAAVINFGFLANAVLTTDDAVKAMR
jgi:nicotinamidase-related amidase